LVHDLLNIILREFLVFHFPSQGEAHSLFESLLVLLL